MGDWQIVRQLDLEREMLFLGQRLDHRKDAVDDVPDRIIFEGKLELAGLDLR